MPSPFTQMSTYLVNLTEDVWVGKNQTMPTVPANLYVCMFSTTPGLADSGGVELTGGGYGRLQIPNTTSYFSAAASRVKVAAGGAYPLAWFTATGTLGPVVAVGVRDTTPGGNLLLLNEYAVGNQQTIYLGNVITFNSTDFSWTIN
jgi:hypothetical protein